MQKTQCDLILAKNVIQSTDPLQGGQAFRTVFKSLAGGIKMAGSFSSAYLCN